MVAELPGKQRLHEGTGQEMGADEQRQPDAHVRPIIFPRLRGWQARRR